MYFINGFSCNTKIEENDWKKILYKKNLMLPFVGNWYLCTSCIVRDVQIELYMTSLCKLAE